MGPVSLYAPLPPKPLTDPDDIMANSVLGTRPPMHKRNTSFESNSSTGSAHRLILEHMLQYPGTYELPLRTMYALNSVPHATGNASPKKQYPGRPEYAAQRLETSLLVELSQLPHQPTALPPAFLASFVRKCFASELMLVDFQQALTALDYLKDLESRRTRELKAAMDRLGINPDNCDAAERMLAQRYPSALGWYRGVAEKTHKIEALYTPLYLALRRWILINELSLVPFSKHNCVAMLNTLYPPVHSSQTAPRLAPGVLKSQRDVFFKYIQAVEKNGSQVVGNLIAHGQRPGDETGWPPVRELLDKYLHTSSSMIDECLGIINIHDAAKIEQDARRKADSGIDFVNSRKSSTSSEKSEADLERPPSRGYKSSTALEKIAREFRHMRRTKTDVSEIMPFTTELHTQPNPPNESKTLRKMKSLGSLGLRRQASRAGLVPSPPKTPDFDVAKMSEQRKAFEATMTANSEA